MRAFFILLFATAVVSAWAASSPSDSLNQEPAKRGWFFYEDPEKEKPSEPRPDAAGKPQPDKESARRCRDKATWTPDCGFVDPGKDFEFQAKQRDALIERMSLSANDAKAVEDFQRYMRWVLRQATEVANLWYYNTVQNPELDPTVSQPVSQFGVRLMADVRAGHKQDIFKALAEEGAGLVYFTRSDCSFCKSMAPIVKDLGEETGLPVWNAALDDRCEEVFKARCRTGKAVAEPARQLKVTIVPTLFLALPDNTWIRIGTGVTDSNTLSTRIVTFWTAYRNALLKGMQPGQDGRAPVDFGEGREVASGTAKGVRLPSEAEVMRMLGERR